MGFVIKKYSLKTPIKATAFLLQLGYSKAATQRIIDKARLKQNGMILQKSSIIAKGVVEIIEFESRDLGLQPSVIIDNHSPESRLNNQQECPKKRDSLSSQKPDSKDRNFTKHHLSFCIFNKPAKLLTHPKNLSNNVLSQASLLEQLRYSFGSTCNPCHRLDYETSGLLICALDKHSEKHLKNLFLERAILKEYLAIVRGRITKPLIIESDIVFPQKFGNLCIKGEARNTRIQILEKEKADFLLRTFGMGNNMKNNIKDSLRDFVRDTQSNRAISLIIPIKPLTDFQSLQKVLQTPFCKRIFTENIFQSKVKNSYKTSNIALQKLVESYKSFRRKLLISPHDSELVHTPTIHKSIFLKDSCESDFTTNVSKFTYAMNDCRDSCFSFVRLIALTGKTHQLRIHAETIKHPILGDTLYGIKREIASFFLDSKSKCDLESNFITPMSEDILAQFRTYYQNLTFYREQILRDMRLYYTNSNRLLLHAYKVSFLGKSFCIN